MKRPSRLFELLVVGGGLLLASGSACGAVDDPLTTATSQGTTTTPRPRTLADGGVSDAGVDTGDTGGTGSGFW